MSRISAIVMLSICCGGMALAAEPSFTVKPAAVRSGDTVEITFAVNQAADVEVAIVNAQGKVVRHLAAGLLGPNAPEPLKKGSLAQELVWDGKDDFGKPVSAPARLRVAIGLKPTLDRMIGDNPGAIVCPQGIAVGPEGNLYVLHVYGRLHPGDATPFVTVFDRSGKYLRTILPYPANLPEDKLTGIKRVTLQIGKKVPFIYQAETRSLLAGAGNIISHQPVVMPDGQFVFIGHHERPSGLMLRYNQPGIKRATAINADGSMPTGGPYRTILADRSASQGALALSPDGKTLYAAGIAEGKTPPAEVTRFTLADQAPQPFITKGLKEATGLAVDREGRLYVADRGRGCVAVFSSDGSPAGEIEIANVRHVAVSSRTGAVYAVTSTPGTGRESSTYEVVKFASAKAREPAARLALKMPWMGDREKEPLIAVDGTADQPTVWVGIGGGHFSVGNTGDLFRIEDRGDSLGPAVSINSLAGNARASAGPVLSLAANRADNTLLVNDRIYELATDRWRAGLAANIGSQKGVGSFGLDGNFYSQVYLNQVFRYGPDLKPLAFAGLPGNSFSRRDQMIGGGQEIRARGITADRAGNIYTLWNTGRREGNLLFAHNLAKYGPDGKEINADLVDAQANVLNSVRVDLAGNIYLAAALRPPGQQVPAGMKAEFGRPWDRALPSTQMEWYGLMYGSIIKFGPEGGQFRQGIGGTPMEFSWDSNLEVKGARWVHFGASPVISWRIGPPDSCFCESARFDVDWFGRAFYQDAARFRIGILDTAGNVIGQFGCYGNADSAGPGSAIAQPEIPLFWPYVIECMGDRVYIGDRMNRRIVVVRLDYAAVEHRDIN